MWMLFFFVCGHHVLDIILLVFSFLTFSLFYFCYKTNTVCIHARDEQNMKHTHILWRFNWVKEPKDEKSQQRTKFVHIFNEFSHTHSTCDERVENKERNTLPAIGRKNWRRRNTHAHLHHTSCCEFNTNISINKICKPVKYIRNL